MADSRTENNWGDAARLNGGSTAGKLKGGSLAPTPDLSRTLSHLVPVSSVLSSTLALTIGFQDSRGI